MRIWFSDPRILGIRPGISFALSELTKPSRRKRGGELPPEVLAKLADPRVMVNIERVLREHGEGHAQLPPPPAIEFAKYRCKHGSRHGRFLPSRLMERAIYYGRLPPHFGGDGANKIGRPFQTSNAILAFCLPMFASSAAGAS